jgi:hypothetical protein
VRRVPRASGKTVWAWPPLGAVDAGTMQIQLREGVSLGRRGCAVGRNPRHGAPRELARRKEYRPGCAQLAKSYRVRESSESGKG